MQNRLLIVALFIIFLAYLAGALSLTLFNDQGQAKDIAATAQSWATIAAFAIAGLFAYFKLELFRDLAPHLTISHEISHRLIGDSYIHISVTANLHNSSRVRMDFRKGFFRLQQIGPASDDEVESLYAQVFIDKDHDHFQ